MVSKDLLWVQCFLQTRVRWTSMSRQSYSMRVGGKSTLTAARITQLKRCCTGSTGLWKSSARLLLMRWSATNARRKALLRSLRDQASYRTSCASFSAHLVSSAAAFFPFCPVQRSGASETTSTSAHTAGHLLDSRDMT